MSQLVSDQNQHLPQKQRKLSLMLPLSLGGATQSSIDNYGHHQNPSSIDQLNPGSSQCNLDKNKKKVNISSLDLSKIQGMSNGNKKSSRTDGYYHGAQSSRDTINRLNQIKGEFQILRDIMIDSTIVEVNHKNNDKNNGQFSERQSSIKGQHLKMGQAIRGKQRNHHKNRINSQSNSQRQPKTQRIRPHDKNDSDQPNSNIKQPEKYKDVGMEEKGEKMEKGDKNKYQKNKYEKQNRSYNTKQYKNTSKVVQKRQQLKLGSFISNNILEKHSLQLRLKSSLQKTENLMQNQITLKTRNHELEQTLRKYMSSSNENQHQVFEMKIRQLKTKLMKCEDELMRERAKCKQLVQRIGRLEGEAVTNEATLGFMKQQKNREIKNVMSMKLNCGNLEIENKRLEMERDIDRRNNQYEVVRLKKQIEVLRNYGGGGTTSEKDRIKQLEMQLQERDRRYRQMLAIEQSRKQRKSQANLMELADKLSKGRREHEVSGSIYSQLRQLKQEMGKLKNQLGVQSKLALLEKALQISDDQRQKYQLQVEQFHKQYQELKTRYQISQDKKQEELQSYIKNMDKLKYQVDKSILVKQQYDEIKEQNRLLYQRINQLQYERKNNGNTEQELLKIKQILRQKDEVYHMQIKDAKKKIDSAQFQVFKSQEQSKLYIDINTRKLMSQIDILNKQIQALEADRDYHKKQLMISNQDNSSLMLKYKDLYFRSNQSVPWQANWEQMRRSYEQQISAITQRFYEQEQKLVEQIVQLTKSNQDKLAVIQRYTMLEGQNNQLRSLCKRNMASGASVNHLWEIKLKQYQNMKLVIDWMKMRNMEPNNCGGGGLFEQGRQGGQKRTISRCGSAHQLVSSSSTNQGWNNGGSQKKYKIGFGNTPTSETQMAINLYQPVQLNQANR